MIANLFSWSRRKLWNIIYMYPCFTFHCNRCSASVLLIRFVPITYQQTKNTRCCNAVFSHTSPPPPTPENWLYSSTPHPGMELLNIYRRLSFIGGYLPYEIHVYLWRANRDLNLKVLYIPRLNKPAYICTRVCRLII